MIKVAIYGKGGIGKSTVTSNLSAALASLGKRVIQIGCDPKADSTANLLSGNPVMPVMNYMREHDEEPTSLDQITREGFGGVLCIETGGPTPGLGCAGRGIINALESLEAKGAYEKYKPDVVIYDVLGDVVCGGFTMPMRKGYADKVYIVTSGEKMSIYAAANIAMAVENFKKRDYAKLGGIILNCRGVEDEEKRARELAADFNTDVITVVPRDSIFEKAEAAGKTVVELFPDSEVTKILLAAADRIMAAE